MSVSVVRYRFMGKESWGVVAREVVRPLSHPALTLREFLEKSGVEEARAKLKEADPVSFALDRVEILNPVTSPCQVVCLGKNYADHIVETGGNVKAKTNNLFFVKASSSLAPAKGNVKKPANVHLLDYEIELGLIVGRKITEGIDLMADQVRTYIAGLIIGNDLSARDLQMSRGQWFQGKSQRGFCPVGPYMVFPDDEEWKYLGDLEIELLVNDEVRQSSNTSNMIYKPHDSLKELSHFMDFYPGDLILTGTPSGVAMQNPASKMQKFREAFLTPAEIYMDFFNKQKASGRYLKAGDRIEARIFHASGELDLGTQELVVVD